MNFKLQKDFIDEIATRSYIFQSITKTDQLTGLDYLIQNAGLQEENIHRSYKTIRIFFLHLFQLCSFA